MTEEYGEHTRGGKITILYASKELIESGQRVMKRLYEEQVRREEDEKN